MLGWIVFVVLFGGLIGVCLWSGSGQRTLKNPHRWGTGPLGYRTDPREGIPRPKSKYRWRQRY